MLITISTSLAHAVVYSGAMDSRSGLQHIPGFIAQSKAFKAGGNPGEGLRLEWQVDNATTPGAWTYTYRLIRGTSKSKGFAFFDIETAGDFTAANILSRKMSWATNRNDGVIPSGLASITISDPANFNAVHDFSNAAVTEASFSPTALSKNHLSHYSGDPGIAAPEAPAGDASDTPSVGPVPHPFYGIRVTFPGSNADLAYEACEWEFSIVSDRAPMWGSFFGWGDKTQTSPFWYANFYNSNIDNPDRLALPPANNLYGTAPYTGWILVPGPQTVQATRLGVDLATYSRSSGGNGSLNLVATALPNAVLTVNGNGIATTEMTPDTPNPAVFGRFSVQIPFIQLPATIDISNNRDPVFVSPHTVPLVDEIVITQATYNPTNRLLTIKASSKDRMAPLLTLTAPDFAIPNTLDAAGALVKTLTANPPHTITVTSSKGGTATAQVVYTSVSNFTVTAGAGANGGISPAGANVATPGSTLNFTITPDPGFSVAALVVDSQSLPGATTYSFTNIQTDHYINAYFAPLPYKITATAAANGSISPAGVTGVANNGSQTYTITPNDGYQVNGIVVDGTFIAGATSYTFSNVTGNHYINAYFEPLPHKITSVAAANGVIVPAGVTGVANNGSQTYTITPNDGYQVNGIVVDGTFIAGTTSYTFSNVTGNHYINAYFAVKP